MHTRILVVASSLVIATACTGPGGNDIDYSGFVMEDFYNIQVGQEWRFISNDPAIPYFMRGATVDNPTDGIAPDVIYTIEYSKECFQDDDPACVDGEFLFSWDMASNGSRGVHLYSSTVGTTVTAYDPPLKITTDQMKATDVVETVTGGTTWTSEFVNSGPCEIAWADWNGCPTMTLDDGGANSGLAGTYTVASGWNVVGIQYEGESSRWSLEKGWAAE